MSAASNAATRLGIRPIPAFVRPGPTTYDVDDPPQVDARS